MSKTKIEWATDVWNPVTGCTKVSEGCRNCYAERVVKRFGERVHGLDQVPSYPDFIGPGDAETRAFTDVACHPDRLDQPLHWRKPRTIFVCSMGDLFHDAVTDEFIAAVFAVMAACPQHTFIVLTKRPNRMRGWFSWLASMGAETARLSDAEDGPIWTLQVAMKCARDYGSAVAGCRVEWPLPNVIGMVSVEDQAAADSRVTLLLQSPFAIRGISYEPALGRVELWALPDGSWHDSEGADRYNALTGCAWYGGTADHGLSGGPIIDWVICGGESGPGARPMHPDWVRSIRDECADSGVPFFFKQWGEWAPTTMLHEMSIAPGNASHPWGLCNISMTRIGKKAAGHGLDGQVWQQFPQSMKG